MLKIHFGSGMFCITKFLEVSNFFIFLLAKYRYVNLDQMSGSCSTYGGEKKCIQGFDRES